MRCENMSAKNIFLQHKGNIAGNMYCGDMYIVLFCSHPHNWKTGKLLHNHSWNVNIVLHVEQNLEIVLKSDSDMTVKMLGNLYSVDVHQMWCEWYISFKSNINLYEWLSWFCGLCSSYREVNKPFGQ